MGSSDDGVARLDRHAADTDPRQCGVVCCMCGENSGPLLLQVNLSRSWSCVCCTLAAGTEQVPAAVALVAVAHVWSLVTTPPQTLGISSSAANI